MTVTVTVTAMVISRSGLNKVLSTLSGPLVLGKRSGIVSSPIGGSAVRSLRLHELVVRVVLVHLSPSLEPRRRI